MNALEKLKLTKELRGLSASMDSLKALDKLKAAKRVRELVTLLGGQSKPAVELTGKELGDFPDTEEGKKALREVARTEFEKLKGNWIDCPALDKLEGKDTKVEIRNRGIKEFFAHSGDPRKLKLVAEIAKIIKTAKAAPDSWQANTKADKKRSAEGYYHLESNISLEGLPLKVDVVIEKDNNGLLHYDVIVPRDAEDKKMPERPVPDNYSGGDSGTEAGEPTYNSILGSGQWVVNLFIEGEEPEVIAVEDSDDFTALLQGIVDGATDTVRDDGKLDELQDAFEQSGGDAMPDNPLFGQAFNAAAAQWLVGKGYQIAA